MMVKSVQMKDEGPAYPEWLINQRGMRYRSQGQISLGAGGWFDRDTLVGKYADHLLALGEPVTLTTIRSMLRFVDRGYSLKADQIGRALRSRYADGRIPKFTNASTVVIDGRRYGGIRVAATREGVSPQTVINRVKSDKREWKGWRLGS